MSLDNTINKMMRDALNVNKKLHGEISEKESRIDFLEKKNKKLEADLRVSIETLKKLKEIRNQKDLNLSEFDSTEALGGLFNYIELAAKQALEKIRNGITKK